MLICFYNGIPPSRRALLLALREALGLSSPSGLCHTVTEGSEVASNPLILIFTRRGLFMQYRTRVTLPKFRFILRDVLLLVSPLQSLRQG